MVFSGNGRPSDGLPSGQLRKKSLLLGTPWGDALILALFAAFITLYGLGSTSLHDNDETRFGLLARGMVETGDWVVPRWSHRPQGTKPPLFMWAIAGVSQMIGQWNSWSVRLPSALAGIGVVLLTYLLGRRFFPPPVPFLAGLVAGTNLSFYSSARIAQTDMLLTFFILLAATLALEGHSRRGRERFFWVIGAYVAAGLGILTKGPVGLLFPGMIVLSVLAVRKDWKKVPILAHVTGLAVALIIAGSWYFLYQESSGEAASQQVLIRENLIRYFIGFDHIAPFYYYVYTFAAEFMPWSPIFALALGWAWIRRKAMTADYGAVLLWFGTIFFFFSLSASKRSQYILPLYPAAALLTAAFLGAVMTPAGKGLTRWRTAGVWTFRILAVAAVGVAVGGGILTSIMFRVYLIPAIAASIILLVFGVWMLRETYRTTLSRVILVIPMGFLVTHLFVQPLVAPHLERRKSPRPYAQEVSNLVGGHHLVAYNYSRPSLDFYASARKGETFYVYHWDALLYFFQDYQEPIYVLMDEKNYRKIPSEALQGARMFRRNLRYRKDSVILLTNDPYKPNGSKHVGHSQGRRLK
jgi:4-amino-4-deoxy-L-arabinose transferase-like glycosyltransferase